MKKSEELFTQNKYIAHTHALMEEEELTDVPMDASHDTHWGYELLADASGCNNDINDPKKIEEFLDELVVQIKMKKLGKLNLVQVEDEEEGHGISACQFVTTSSLIIHTDMNKNTLYLDCFSCAPYDVKVPIRLIKEFFKPKHIATKFIYRDAGGV